MNARRMALAVGALATLLAGATTPLYAVYDLTADWSDAANPNGVWSLKKNHADLFTTNLPDYFQNGSNQAAWADDPSPQLRHVPVWMKTNAEGLIHAHGAELDRTGSDYTGAVWTSPLAGEIQIDGEAWTTWLSGRAMRWQLRVNGALVSEGDLIANGSNDAGNPFDFADGSGGPGVLTQIVGVGDQVELGLLSVSQGGNLGDTIGLRFAIVPEPATLVFLAAGALSLTVRRKRA